MAVAIVECLEVVDVDHHEGERFAGRAAPFLVELGIEAVAIGQPRRLSSLVRRSRCAFATRNSLPLGEALRHGVERVCQRHELGRPTAARRADREIAVADVNRHAGKRAQRPHDHMLAAEPHTEQDQDADQHELEIRHAHLAIDPAQHVGLVEVDGKNRVGIRQPRETE
jgi:hypothetical protein